MYIYVNIAAKTNILIAVLRRFKFSRKLLSVDGLNRWVNNYKSLQRAWSRRRFQ